MFIDAQKMHYIPIKVEYYLRWKSYFNTIGLKFSLNVSNIYINYKLNFTNLSSIWIINKYCINSCCINTKFFRWYLSVNFIFNLISINKRNSFKVLIKKNKLCWKNGLIFCWSQFFCYKISIIVRYCFYKFL